MKEKNTVIISILMAIIMFSSVISMGAEIEYDNSESVNISFNDNPVISYVPDGSIGEVTKKIWNETSETWDDSIYAMINDALRFNITIVYIPTTDHDNDSIMVDDITLTDTLPTCLEYSNNASVIYGYDEIFGESGVSGNTIFWNLSSGIFAPYDIELWNLSYKPYENNSVSIYYNATVIGNTDSYGEENNVDIIAYETCPHRNVTGNASAKIYVEDLIDEPCIDITKEVDDSTVNIGENVTFTLTIHNCGEINLTNVLVVDDLPSFLTYNNDANPTPDSSSDHHIEWTFGLIPKGGTEIITFSAHADEEGEDYNIANVTCDQPVADGSHACSIIIIRSNICICSSIKCRKHTVVSLEPTGYSDRIATVNHHPSTTH